jgi:hypothetical protein
VKNGLDPKTVEMMAGLIAQAAADVIATMEQMADSIRELNRYTSTLYLEERRGPAGAAARWLFRALCNAGLEPPYWIEDIGWTLHRGGDVDGN